MAPLDYGQCLAAEAEAWRSLVQSQQDGRYGVEAFTAWLAASRRSAKAREQTTDALLEEDPGLMSR